MPSYSIFSGFFAATLFALGVTASAQPYNKPVQLPQLEIERGRMKLVPDDPIPRAVIARVRSRNMGVVNANPYRNRQVQIRAVGTGRTEVEFFDSASNTAYLVPVWV